MYPQNKNTVLGETVEQIIDMIRKGDYAPGDRLPGERVLASELNVGRTSVREAFIRLESMGLIEARQGLGTFVKDPSKGIVQSSIASNLLPGKDTIDDLFEIREIIEVEAAGRAAIRAGEDELVKIKHWVEAVETYIAREDAQSLIVADTEFHRQIILATNNDILVELMDSISNLLRESRQDSLQIPDLTPLIIEGHRAIYAAIESGDRQAARKAMSNHLNTISAGVEEYWKKQREDNLSDLKEEDQI